MIVVAPRADLPKDLRHVLPTVDRDATDSHDLVVDLQAGDFGRRTFHHRTDRCRQVPRDAVGEHQPVEHQEGQEEVGPDAGQNHNALLPELLLAVGAAHVTGGDLLERVHTDYPDVTAKRDGLDSVLGLTLLSGPEPRPEPEEELRCLHPDGFGGEEVARLMCRDEEDDRESRC